MARTFRVQKRYVIGSSPVMITDDEKMKNLIAMLRKKAEAQLGYRVILEHVLSLESESSRSSPSIPTHCRLLQEISNAAVEAKFVLF